MSQSLLQLSFPALHSCITLALNIPPQLKQQQQAIWTLHPFPPLSSHKAVGKSADLPRADSCQNGLINIQRSRLLIMQPLIISVSCSLCIFHSSLFSSLTTRLTAHVRTQATLPTRPPFCVQQEYKTDRKKPPTTHSTPTH